MMVEYLDKTRHVRAFEVVRQVHIHIKSSNGMLHPRVFVFNLHWMANTLDADFVDRQLARISHILNIWNECCLGRAHGLRNVIARNTRIRINLMTLI